MNNILDQANQATTPYIDVLEVYLRYMTAYFNTKWYQFAKRTRLLLLLRAFHRNYAQDKELLDQQYQLIYKDANIQLAVNAQDNILAVNNKLISYEFLSAITDRPRLYQPIVMSLGKDGSLRFEDYVKTVGNN